LSALRTIADLAKDPTVAVIDNNSNGRPTQAR
jgi:hypothetical protein